MSNDETVLIEGLVKRFGSTLAVNGLDLRVPAGVVYGLLGPNGSGKTTTVRILATLISPTAGRAWVCGHEVTAEPDAVRRRIGLIGQHAAVDERLPGRSNLVMFGRLHRLGGVGARRRADELLERFDLTAAADRVVSTYSGGMRRRLDLAAGLIVHPAVLFLDEPTTGLDPRGRNEVWTAIRELAESGTSVLLTTQYLDEADRLADRVAVIEQGRMIAEDTPERLARRVAADRLEITLPDAADAERLGTSLREAGYTSHGNTEEHALRIPIHGGFTTLAAVTAEIQRSAVAVSDVTLRRATLDDVFLSLTGHSAPRQPIAAEDREAAA